MGVIIDGNGMVDEALSDANQLRSLQAELDSILHKSISLADKYVGFDNGYCYTHLQEMRPHIQRYSEVLNSMALFLEKLADKTIKDLDDSAFKQMMAQKLMP